MKTVLMTLGLMGSIAGCIVSDQRPRPRAVVVVEQPRPRYVWVPAHYRPDGYFVEGHWDR